MNVQRRKDANLGLSWVDHSGTVIASVRFIAYPDSGEWEALTPSERPQYFSPDQGRAQAVEWVEWGLRSAGWRIVT